MLTIAKLTAFRSTKPYSSPLKLKVCGVSPVNNYRVENGDLKENWILGMADPENTMKAVLYDRTKLNLCAEGNTVLLFNFIYKDEVPPFIVITNRTKVVRTGPLQVPENLEATAYVIANPPVTPKSPVKQAASSQLKSIVSVEGRVISEDMVKTVQVKGRDTNVKDVCIKDKSGSVKVSLWRDLSLQVSVGQYVGITDLIVTTYNNEISLSSTKRSTVQVLEHPEDELKGSIIGIESFENHFSIVMETEEILEDGPFPSFDVEKNLLVSFLECPEEEVERQLVERLPLECAIVIRDRNVEKIK